MIQPIFLGLLFVNCSSKSHLNSFFMCSKKRFFTPAVMLSKSQRRLKPFGLPQQPIYDLVQMSESLLSGAPNFVTLVNYSDSKRQSVQLSVDSDGRSKIGGNNVEVEGVNLRIFFQPLSLCLGGGEGGQRKREAREYFQNTSPP